MTTSASRLPSISGVGATNRYICIRPREPSAGVLKFALFAPEQSCPSAATRSFGTGFEVPADVGIAEWASALAGAVNDALIYEPGTTSVETQVDGVIAAGRGVCQDFTNVFLAVCRQRGVAARYVSGWLYEPDRAGPVESHAWVEVQVPGAGWVEEDPTHPGEVGDRHVRIAVGRDYGDVVPIKGAYVGGVTESMTVEVELVDLTAAVETA